MQHLRPLPCEVCGDEKGEVAFGAKGLAADDPRFHLRRCGRCGLGWTEPRVPESEIGRWYPAAYYGKGNVRFNALFERLVRHFRLRRARLIASLVSPGPVLDVGCGRGLTLAYLRDLGFEPHGAEITEEGAWHARNRLGIDVFVGDFKRAPFKPGTFSAVIFWHSLEHIERPLEALRHAKKLLRPGGVLVVAVPNFESAQARLFGPHWFHLDIPRHYYHFSERSLERALRDLDFKVARVDHFNFEQTPYGWLQSFYNSAGMTFNFLYSLLKNRTSRIVPIRKHPLQALATVATLPVLLPASVLLTFVETAFRTAGTIDLYAVKH